ncbi:hypothetical protein IV417_01070 [Alphaproteobacteria bacterium KMM 3653]|uniref:Uncharacterized protein n=1 Tax=Harenicola maris TaxID=2841044 RepID=A0AAP2G2T5_9RHOB|nr:hypothetical protein [Harenicola maris]
MTTDDTADKTHYICQTYVETAAKGGQTGLKIDKQFQYTSAADAENRAEREAAREGCAGADAYMLTEDAGSGEVSPPTFLLRIGNVPDLDDA